MPRETPKDYALLVVQAWSTSEEFPGHPFPGLVDAIALGVKTAIRDWVTAITCTCQIQQAHISRCNRCAFLRDIDA